MRNLPTTIRIFKMALLLTASIGATGCVGLDRMLNPISNHTKHYSFTHTDAARGGLMVAGLSDNRNQFDDLPADEWSAALSGAIEGERAEFSVRSGESLRPLLGDRAYGDMLQQYNDERWIGLETLAIIRNLIPERYVILARIDDTSQYKSSSCSERKKKKKKDEDGKDTDEDEDGPTIYDICRTAHRSAVISVDVFDLAQDIIVWSGTRDESTISNKCYTSDEYIGEYQSKDTYRYPSYPSWFSTFKNSAKDLAVHMPHETD